MRMLCALLLSMVLYACAEGPSPRQKYGAMYGVTGTNVPKKEDDPAPREVSVYSRSSLERMQGRGSGATPGVSP